MTHKNRVALATFYAVVILTVLVVFTLPTHADTAKLTWGTIGADCKTLQIALIENYSGSGWDFDAQKFDRFACSATQRIYDIGEGVLWGWRIRVEGVNGLKSKWSITVTKTGARAAPARISLAIE